MISPIIDNSANTELNRVILWQYDSNNELIEVINMLKDFFNQSTGGLWDSVANIMNISDAEHADDFGLSVWGRLIGVPRPSINGVAMSTELYRRIILGRIRLAMSDASVKSYIDFVNYVFDGKVLVSDNADMSISFSWNGTTTGSLQTEMKAALENVPEAIFAYPSGIKSSVKSRGPIFAFSGQQPISESDMLIANFDNGVFNWN